MRTSITDRIFLGAGAFYALASFAGGGGGNSPEIGASGQAIAAYAAGRGGIRPPAILEEIALMALLVFAAALAARIRAFDNLSPLPEIALSGGLLAVALKLGSFGAAFALYSHTQPLQPDVARALYEMNWFGLIGSWFGQSMLLLAVAAAGFALGAFPRWLAGLAGIIGAALLVDASVAVTGSAIPVLELVWIAWALAASITLVIRGEGRAAGLTAAPVGSSRQPAR